MTEKFLRPPASLLCKLGSIIVHVEEATSATGHPFDAITVRQLIDDPEVVAWRLEMAKAGLLPVKR